MSWFHGTATRLKLLFSRRSSESRFDHELQFHVEMEAERLAREESIAPDEARRRALAAFGGVENHREALRAGRDVAWLNGMSLDLKLGLRMLAKYPGLTLVGVLGMSVAVTIGALAFTAVNAVTSSALPFDEGDRVVAIRNIDAKKNDDDATHLHDLEAWREALSSVEGFAAYRIVPTNLVIGNTAPVSLRVAQMTASGFRLTRVQPVLGRYLSDTDERDDAPAVAVIGYDIWQGRLGGRPDAVGMLVQLGTTRYTIVGVMPQGFAFPINNAVWTPLRLSAAVRAREDAPVGNVFGRLAPGRSLSDAQVELTTIAQRLASEYPRSHENIRSRVVPYAHSFLDSPGTAWLLHLGQVAVSLLLVVIGTNVAVLVYARTASRTGEIAVRTALGASRRRIVMQLFGEALTLSALASLVGLLVAHFVFQRVEEMVRLSADGQLPYWMNLRITPAGIVYVAGLTILAAVIIGVIPGLKATRQHVSASLKSYSSTSSLQLGRSWTALLIAQVAISVAALPASLAGSQQWLRMALWDFGTPVTQSFVVATPLMGLDRERFSTEAEAERTGRYATRVAELVQELERQPGITVVLAAHPPSAENQIPIALEKVARGQGLDTLPERLGRYSFITSVDSEFVPSFNIRMLAGRNFASADFVEGVPGVIVNRSFVQHFLGGGNALGRRFRHEPLGDEAGTKPWWEIVGVVEDFPVSFGPEPRVYTPLRPAGLYPVTLAVRAQSLSPVALADRIREVAMRVEPDLRFVSIPTVEALLEQDAVAQRLGLLGLVMVSLSVVLLSAAGIYALMSFTVTRRQREIGIRSALGAGRSRVIGGILSRALKQVGIGIAIGSLATGSLFRLAGDTDGPGNFLVIVGMAGAMAIVGVLASIGPARRALRVQPTEALRSD